MTEPTQRSVKIGQDERTGWSSDRPRPGGANRPPRPVDISVRCRLLQPADRMRYSPGSLVVVVSGSAEERDRFVARVFEDERTVFGPAKVRELIRGRVGDDELEDRVDQLLRAAVAKRLENGDTTILLPEGVGPEKREGFLRLAHASRRPRHLILLEVPRDEIAEDDRATINELRRALETGDVGQEGFQTAMRLGGGTAAEVKRIVFRPPPRDDD